MKRRRLKRGAPDEEAARRWLAENRDALLSSNAYVEQHGLPLYALWRAALRDALKD